MRAAAADSTNIPLAQRLQHGAVTPDVAQRTRMHVADHQREHDARQHVTARIDASDAYACLAASELRAQHRVEIDKSGRMYGEMGLWMQSSSLHPRVEQLTCGRTINILRLAPAAGGYELRKIEAVSPGFEGNADYRLQLVGIAAQCGEAYVCTQSSIAAASDSADCALKGSSSTNGVVGVCVAVEADLQPI